MLFRICFTISISAAIASAILFIISLTLRPHQRRKIKLPVFVGGGVVVSAMCLFIPICHPKIVETGITGFFSGVLTFTTALYNTLKLFVIDSDFEEILAYSSEFNIPLRHVFNVFSGFLYIICPALTATGIMSLFDNFTAHVRYCCGYHKDTYIFSDLNARSLQLARSLRENGKNRIIVFTDVYRANEESACELISQAQEIDAILFKNDITVVNFKFHSPSTKLFFFIIGEDENENINQAICLSAKGEKGISYHSNKVNKFNGYDYNRKGGDTRVILFTTQASSEQQLSSVNPTYLKLRRINSVQSLIYKLLDDDGHLIFESAVDSGRKLTSPFTGEIENEKLISVLLIGMGHHGIEILKALPWFCQLYPYRLEVNAFDKNDNALDKFTSYCPELMDSSHNGDFITDGEAHYSIKINPTPLGESGSQGYDVHSMRFDNAINNIEKVTYVLVALGDDDLNVEIASKIRILLKRKNLHPFIHTIVYNPDKQELLQGGTNHSGMPYNISPTGSISVNFSEKCILNSDIESRALERHLAWTKKFAAQENWSKEVYDKEIAIAQNAFWKYDYNYRSSIASALHAKFKKPGRFPIGVDQQDNTKLLYYEHAGVPGANKKPSERTEQELWYLRKMEHQRWNAYVRSEGYVYAEKRDKLAKTHNLLVPFAALSLAEQEKDDD